jgi:NAD(P)-dependent dehydrogenase (short-subunit alcohol dehydrogenase family)
MKESLTGKVVVLTGASSGIGRATAEAYAARGALLVLAARRTEHIETLAGRLSAQGGTVLALPTDVTDEAAVRRLFGETERRLGPVDILVNNAGTGLAADLSDIEMSTWQQVMAVNVDGVFLCTREAVRQMTKRGAGGHIITVSSVAGRFGAPGFSGYCASKHAVTGMMKALRWELRRQGIRVDTVHPFRVATEFFDAYDSKPTPAEMLDPEDLARLLVALGERALLEAWGVRAANFGKRLTRAARGLVHSEAIPVSA